MKDIELLASLARELDLDAQQQDIVGEIIPKIVDPEALNQLAEARTLVMLQVTAGKIPGGPAYAEAVRIAGIYLEAFVIGYRYAVEKSSVVVP